MDSDYRPHRTTSINSTSNTTNSTAATTTSELFICFTSRLSSSSSSMKISSSTSSKSILSPGRSHSTPQISLSSSSSSLSRRLKNSGSLKGGLGQGSSPMFPNTKKRSGGSNAFENPEPSSPKVTCIGQVRVKTKKKHAKKLRSSRSSSSHHKGGEVSFRKLENVESIGQEGLGHRNQKWVHFPVSICEALRSIGADLNCFLPCMNGDGGDCEKSKEYKVNGSAGGGHNASSNSNSGSSSSCGAVIARWLVALHDGDGKGREIELVVGEEEGGGHRGGFGDEEEEEVMEVSRRSQRRHIFEGLEFNDEMINKGHEKEDDEEEKGRVSICIPPKNALLLMRCRSDPVKMAALASKFCGSPQPVDSKEDEEEEEDKDESFEDCVEEEDDKEEKDENFEACEDKIEEQIEIGEEEEEEGQGAPFNECEKRVLVETQEAESGVVFDDDDVDADEGKDYDSDALEEIIVKQIVSIVREEELGYRDQKEEELEVNSGDLSMLDRERLDLEGKERVENNGNCKDIASKTEHETRESMGEAEKVMEEKGTCEEHGTREKTTRDGSEFDDLRTHDGGPDKDSEPKNQQEKEKPVLPDCLLLMMYEPKLSMEVSKETWVCSTDFVRFLPDRTVGKVSSKTEGGESGDELKKKAKTECRHPYPALTTQQTRILQQPPRNSCSFPAQARAGGTGGGAESMAAVIEKKLVSAKAYEPFVLTRCKSEPMRSAIKLAPDACFWKNRKHEPHRSSRIRVKAAGIGF